ncbi:hypothetical protein TR75_11135 [Hydrogenibacillus schlegelii]|nr:hypothetical protein TR75_11135 [Hydrogenibacillus schlegelii]
MPDDRLRTLEAFLKRLPESVRKKIRAVTIDLKESWKKLIQRVLPEARVVADPFHVLQDASRRVDEARRVERCTGHRLPAGRFAKTKQTSPSIRRKRRPRPAGLRNGAQFHGVKEELRDLSRAASLEEAKAILDRIRFEAEGASDAALVPWGRTLKRRKNEILADHPWRTTNGDTEGVHPKIERRNRIRDGFKNREGVVRKMLLAFIPFAHRIA